MTVPTTLQPGDEVYVWYGVIGDHTRFGVVTEHRPNNRGYLVRPTNSKQAFGWGYNEMIPIPKPDQCWLYREGSGQVIVHYCDRSASTVVTNVGSWPLVVFGRKYKPAPRSRWQRLMEL